MTDTDNISILDVIARRRSLRAFDPGKDISDEALLALFGAARWAPSAYNEQPWRFVYARKGSEAYDKLFSALSPSNQVWVSYAPVLVLVAAKLVNSHNGQSNRHALHDTGLAMGMLSVQATELGINLHQMGGFDHVKAETLFNIPPEFEAVTITAAGYPGNISQLPEALQQREQAPRNRKALSEIAGEGSWSF
jgi:nitroreductase